MPAWYLSAASDTRRKSRLRLPEVRSARQFGYIRHRYAHDSEYPDDYAAWLAIFYDLYHCVLSDEKFLPRFLHVKRQHIYCRRHLLYSTVRPKLFFHCVRRHTAPYMFSFRQSWHFYPQHGFIIRIYVLSLAIV